MGKGGNESSRVVDEVGCISYGAIGTQLKMLQSRKQDLPWWSSCLYVDSHLAQLVIKAKTKVILTETQRGGTFDP